MRIIHVGAAAALQIDGLPDAAGVGIAARGVVALLADQRRVFILAVGGLIVDLQGDLVVACLDIVGDVKLKRGVAALVVADLLAVDIQRAEPIDRTKLQEDLLAFGEPGVVQVEVAFIPRGAEIGAVLNAAGRGFPRERDIDFEGIISIFIPGFVFAHLIGVKFEVPNAVEVHPLVALPVRARMFAAGDLAAGRGRDQDVFIRVLDVHILLQLDAVCAGVYGLRDAEHQLGIAHRNRLHDGLRFQGRTAQRHQFRGDAFGEVRAGQGDGAAQPLVLIQLGIVGIHVVHNRAGEVRREIECGGRDLRLFHALVVRPAHIHMGTARRLEPVHLEIIDLALFQMDRGALLLNVPLVDPPVDDGGFHISYVQTCAVVRVEIEGVLARSRGHEAACPARARPIAGAGALAEHALRIAKCDIRVHINPL